MRTLKKRENISLILDDEFLEYCELNKIEDPKRLAKDIFDRGFTLLKFGKKPTGINFAIDRRVEDNSKAPENIIKTEKKDIYDE